MLVTAALLAALKHATLSRPLTSISSIHTQGYSVLIGIRAQANEYDDVRRERFTETLDGGALTGASGWDGSRAWSEDYSGLVHVDGGESGRLQAIDQAYLDTFGYLRPDYGGAKIAYAGKRKNGSVEDDVVSVTPPHGSLIDLWIDPRTHLIDKETTTVGIVSITTTFSDYHSVDGVKFPFRSTFQSSQGNGGTTQLERVTFNENVAARMAMPASHAHDFSISGGTSTTVPLQVINNHLYLQARVDGQGPYTFILDSGGDYIITPELAKALHEHAAGGLQIGGVGNTTEGASFARVDSIAIGDATVRNQYMLVLPIATGFGVAEGVHIDGMVGYQLLARFLTTIDYANDRITFAMPGAAQAPAGGESLAFYFDNTIPRIPIAVDGVPVSGEVDTGSRAALTLSEPFTAAHPAIAASATTPPTVDGFGVGGPSFARLGRVQSLQIGSFDLHDALAAFGVQQKGAFADPFNPANLGGGIWRRFTVTFDYAHQRMMLQKNADFDTPFAYDRSGMFLVDANGTPTVIAVTPGTPAAAANIAKGDAIVQVNGAPASAYPLPKLRALLMGAPGTAVHLQIRTPAGARDVTLTLRNYV